MAVRARLADLAGTGRGLIDFASYMAVVLYDPDDGFYATSAVRAARRGDFVTSPELGDGFARCVVTWAGRRGLRRLADVGGGRGSLAGQVRAIAAERNLDIEVAVVDVSAAARAVAGADGLTVAETVAELPWVPDAIVANELLDNLPVRLMSGPATELCVHLDGDRLEWGTRRAEDDLAELVEAVPRSSWEASPHGVVPVPVAAFGWIETLPRHAALLVADYGNDAEALLARPDSPVRAYRGQSRADPLSDPGEVDVTCEVPLDLVEPRVADRMSGCTRWTQADWLTAHGLEELRGHARKERDRSVRSRDTMGELRARHRLNEFAALVERSGLGGFFVLEA